ncbi:MAG: hypothetical protein LWY06_05770 [Firmicutes bacterium]|nr:hypothetical protein [Bacillota bacterium]
MGSEKNDYVFLIFLYLAAENKSGIDISTVCFPESREPASLQAKRLAAGAFAFVMFTYIATEGAILSIADTLTKKGISLPSFIPYKKEQIRLHRKYETIIKPGMEGIYVCRGLSDCKSRYSQRIMR